MWIWLDLWPVFRATVLTFGFSHCDIYVHCHLINYIRIYSVVTQCVTKGDSNDTVLQCNINIPNSN